MAKKAPFFSHDMNARHDPKISAMRLKYGSEGYGWFWMLVEMMAESDGYKLDMQSKHSCNAYAMQLQCKREQLDPFLKDCIEDFELFESDEQYFWSKSLRRRMEYRDAVSEKRTEAARRRWDKEKDDMQLHSKSNPNAMQNDANKTKQNETKKHLVDSDECDRTFNEFWNLYPKKQGKAGAEKKWNVYFKKGLIDMEKIISGTRAYIAFIDNERKRGFDRQYLNGQTFVNGQTWNDDWGIKKAPTTSTVTPFIPTEKVREDIAKAAERQAERNKQQRSTGTY